MKAAVLREVGTPLQIEDVQISLLRHTAEVANRHVVAPAMAAPAGLERLRALGPQAPHPDTQRLFARFQTDHGADHIPLFRPHMQQATAMLG